MSCDQSSNRLSSLSCHLMPEDDTYGAQHDRAELRERKVKAIWVQWPTSSIARLLDQRPFHQIANATRKQLSKCPQKESGTTCRLEVTSKIWRINDSSKLPKTVFTWQQLRQRKMLRSFLAIRSQGDSFYRHLSCIWSQKIEFPIQPAPSSPDGHRALATK